MNVQRIRIGNIRRRAILAAGVALIAPFAHAADGTWTGAVDALWSSPGNWVGAVPGNNSGAAGTSTDVATFNGTPANNLIEVDANRNVRSIVFESSAPAVGVQGSIVIGSAGANAGNPIYLSGGGFIRTNPTFVGSGTTNLATLNAPMVLTGTSFTFDVQSGSTTDTLPGMVLNGSITAGAGAPTTITFDGVHGAQGSSRAEIESAIADGPGGAIVSVIKNGPGTWEMNQGTLNANTYSGDTIINGGILRASDGADGLGGFSPNSLYVVNGGGTLRNSVAGTSAKGIVIGIGGIVNASTAGGAAGTTMNLTSSNGPSLHLDFDGGDYGTGTVVMARLPLNLTGTTPAEGGVKLSAGPLTPAIRIGASNSDFNLGSVVRTFDVAQGNPLNSFDLRMDGPVIGGGANGGITKIGNGTLRLNNIGNSFVGTVSIQAGTLAGDANNVFGANNPLRIDGGTLHVFGGAGSLQSFSTVTATKGAITAGSTITSTVSAGAFALNVGAGDSFSAAAVLADRGGASALVKTGAGVATLTGNNTYTGGTVVNGGVLSVNTNSEDVILTGAGADLQRGKLVFDYTGGESPQSSIVNTILTPGFAANFATGQIKSTTAVAGSIGLGWNDNGTGNFTVGYARYGDANLDGVVNLDDFTALAGGFGSAGGWAQGDFNYNGAVNLDDFTALAAGFGQTVPLARSSVPEPAGLSVLTILGAALLRRRRS